MLEDVFGVSLFLGLLAFDHADHGVVLMQVVHKFILLSGIEG